MEAGETTTDHAVIINRTSGPNLAATIARRKIGIGGLIADLRHATHQLNLAAAGLPQKGGRCARTDGQLAALGAVDIGEEDEAILVQGL